MKFIFRKNETNNFYALYKIANDSVDLNAKLGNTSVYKIIDGTEAQYNDVKSLKKRVAYDSNDNLIFEDANEYYLSAEEINGWVQNLEETGSAERISAIQALKQADFSNYTYPLTKSLGSIAEEKGTTWVDDEIDLI